MKLNALFIGIGLLSVMSMQAQTDTVLIKTFGGPNFEKASAVIACSDGGYAVIGTTGSNQTGNTDMFLLRLDDELNCVWHYNYGGAQVEWGIDLVEDMSGNFLLLGYGSSYGNGSYDIQVMKVNSEGTLLWNHAYGGQDWDFGTAISRHPQGGFLITGNTYSDGAGDQDGIIYHIDGNGTELNEWIFGYEREDAVQDIVTLPDGWAVVGYVTENDTVKASVWRMNSEDELLWNNKRVDVTHEIRGRAIATDGTYLYATGSKVLGEEKQTYRQRFNPEGNEIDYWFIPHDMEDVAVWNGMWYFGGRTELNGFGRADGCFEKYTVDGGYQGGLFAATDRDEEFECIIATEQGIVLCGRFDTQDRGDQAAVLLYRRSEVFSETSYAPIELDCFVVEVEEPEEQDQATFAVVDIIDLQGRLMGTGMKCSVLQHNNPWAAGIYIIRDTATGACKKLFID
ncbi:MAG: hypothetical protein ACK478_12115 [Flavobacteriales bacterium]|jgi:hypothetical protein